MKILALPVMIAAFVGFAAPAMAAGCSYSAPTTATSEKPADEEAKTS
ncbi:MAG: hypothetical protein AAF677_01730 [Pseudomonadota bacterium]